MPASQKFAVVLTAVDQFSKVFQNLVKSILSVKQPIAQTNAQLQALKPGKGAKEISEQVTELGDVMKGALGGLGKIIPELAGIATGAGAAALVQQTIQYGTELNRNARSLGVNIDLIQDYQKKMWLATGSTEGAVEGLNAFADRSVQAYYYGTPLLNMLQRFGFQFKKNADGSFDFADELKQVEAIYKRLVATQGVIQARTFAREAGVERFTGMWLQTGRAQQTQDQIAREQRITKAAADKEEATAIGVAALGGKVMQGTSSLWKKFTDAIDDPAGTLLLYEYGVRRPGKPGAATPVPVEPVTPSGPIPGVIKTPEENRADVEADMRRRYPDLFSPVPSVALPELKHLRIDLNINNGKPVVTTEGGSGVEVNTQFGHSMPAGAP